MADFGMAAFTPFFMQRPSFLAHQRRREQGHGRSNCQSLSDTNKIPKDNQIRKMLDPVSLSLLFLVFSSILSRLQESAGLIDTFHCFGGHVLIALVRNEYFCFDKLHCTNCSTRRRKNETIEYFHAILAATLVAPGHDKVIQLEPEFIVPRDGADKQDCENRAANGKAVARGEDRLRQAELSTPLKTLYPPW